MEGIPEKERRCAQLIKVKYIKQNEFYGDRKYSCDNCNRRVPFILKYGFFDKGKKEPYTTLHLCEDCSNAMANLHYRCREEGKAHKYDIDEITQIEKEEGN